MLPEKICRCEHVSEFLRPRPQDLREEYPPVEKITNLYGQPFSLLTALSNMAKYSFPIKHHLMIHNIPNVYVSVCECVW